MWFDKESLGRGGGTSIQWRSETLKSSFQSLFVRDDAAITFLGWREIRGNGLMPAFVLKSCKSKPHPCGCPAKSLGVERIRAFQFACLAFILKGLWDKWAATQWECLSVTDNFLCLFLKHASHFHVTGVLERDKLIMQMSVWYFCVVLVKKLYRLLKDDSVWVQWRLLIRSCDFYSASIESN